MDSNSRHISCDYRILSLNKDYKILVRFLNPFPNLGFIPFSRLSYQLVLTTRSTSVISSPSSTEKNILKKLVSYLARTLISIHNLRAMARCPVDLNFPPPIPLSWTPSGVLGYDSLPQKKKVSRRYRGPLLFPVMVT